MITFSESGPHISEFSSFESREAAFNRAVGHMIPARYLGPQRFWEEFRRITETGQDPREHLPAFITSNPRDCLAFGTVDQVLAAVQLRSRHGHSPSHDMDRILTDFGLKAARNQPLRTLSGGETVRLALAKAQLAAHQAANLVIASPFCWLSRNHQPLLKKVFRHYHSHLKPVDMFIMRGESSQEPIPSTVWQGLGATPLTFGLQLDHLHIHLGTPINTITAPQARARVADFGVRLTSPCLLQGDNGQGKSLLAKVLCGALGYEGTLRIESQNAGGQGRLLFQDVVTQTLLRSKRQLARSGAPYAGDRKAREIFDSLWELQAKVMSLAGVQATEAVSESLLAVKTMLIAVRLTQLPVLLILDEPDWGLTREAAIGLVLAVILKAHQIGVPVMLISHKPWWQSVAASSVRVSKALGSDSRMPFEIQLQTV